MEAAMKKVRFLILGVCFLMAQSVFAGVLYGTARIGRAPAAGAEIFVACPGFSRPNPASATATTDAQGSFSLRVPATGRCEMKVKQRNQTGNAFEVLVSNNPLRFDFELDGAMNRVR
jgi:hypothetical protein